MARTAPGVERAVAVLDFLSQNNREGFGVSELARRLDLPKATCHAVLGSLCAAGYVVRSADRGHYRLGPALIPVGRAAEEVFAVVDFARDQMRSLAQRFELECFATVAVGEEILIVARAGGPRPLGLSVRVGERLPLVPPFGTVFMAWADEEDLRGWLARVGSGLSETHVSRYRATIATVRARGYLADLAGEPAHGQPGLAGGVPDSAHVAYLAAPVFDRDGRVALALTMVGFPGQVRAAAEDAALAEALCRSAQQVTEAIHGRAPAPA